jgi:VIT1/CCC1 family predicted Fe2+/Mn2+ transporter
VLADESLQEANPALSPALGFVVLVLAGQLHASVSGGIEPADDDELGLSGQVLLSEGEIAEQREGALSLGVEEH